MPPERLAAANRCHRRKPFRVEGLLAVATLTGLEPATSAVTGRHANQLRYRALLLYSIVKDAIVTPTGFEPVLPP